MTDQTTQEFNDLVLKQGLMLTVKYWWKEHNKTLPFEITNKWDFDTYYKIFNSTKKNYDEKKPWDYNEDISLNDFSFDGMKKTKKTFKHYRDICRELIDITNRKKYLQDMWNLAKNFDDYLWICRLAQTESDFTKKSLEEMKKLTDTTYKAGTVLAIAYQSGDKSTMNWAMAKMEYLAKEAGRK